MKNFIIYQLIKHIDYNMTLCYFCERFIKLLSGYEAYSLRMSGVDPYKYYGNHFICERCDRSCNINKNEYVCCDCYMMFSTSEKLKTHHSNAKIHITYDEYCNHCYNELLDDNFYGMDNMYDCERKELYIDYNKMAHKKCSIISEIESMNIIIQDVITNVLYDFI